MGGSESRFVIHQEQAGRTYITQAKKSKVNDVVEYDSRDTSNQLQKVVIKTSDKYASIRYDLHPQNYIGVSLDGKVVMSDKYSTETHWKVLLFQKKHSSESSWTDVGPQDLNLGFDKNKECSLKVAFFHPATKSFLNFVADEDSPSLLKIPNNYADGLISDEGRSEFAAQLVTACWCLECVATNLSDKEGTIIPNFPMIVVGDNTFGGFKTLEDTPVVGVSSGSSIASYGFDKMVDQLENLVFDSARSGLMPHAWEDNLADLQERVATLEAKLNELSATAKV